MQVDGPGQKQQAFKLAAQFLAGDSGLPRHEMRLTTLADALRRHGSSLTRVSGSSSLHLLCDPSGEPHLSFVPVDGPALAAAAGRASMAAALNDTLRADQSLSVGIDRAVLHDLQDLGTGLLTRTSGARSAQALQALALGRLFTNDWQAGWQQAPGSDDHPSWHLGACAPFPEQAALRKSLEDMHDFRGLAPLFDIPAEAGPAWDDAMDSALAGKVRGLDVDGLQWTMTLAREAQPKNPVATLPSAETILSAIASIRAVRTLIDEEPTLTLRQLLERFPHRLDVLDEYQAVRHRDAAQQTEPEPARVERSPQISVPRPRRADPPQFISDADLASWRRRYATFNPFKRMDRTIASLLRDAIGLRSKKEGPQRERAAETLRCAAIHAANTLSKGLEGLRRADPRRIEADNKRLKTLWHLITDTENRYQLAPPDLPSEPVKPAGRSWLPWRRRTQGQA
ncbi:hypothetical protein [Roseateles sp.]|uniref:hypothetical protein n=1 Tax=Roseateles sp. TaxID=1971397 RepID=UPI002F3F5513